MEDNDTIRFHADFDDPRARVLIKSIHAQVLVSVFSLCESIFEVIFIPPLCADRYILFFLREELFVPIVDLDNALL